MVTATITTAISSDTMSCTEFQRCVAMFLLKVRAGRRDPGDEEEAQNRCSEIWQQLAERVPPSHDENRKCESERRHETRRHMQGDDRFLPVSRVVDPLGNAEVA